MHPVALRIKSELISLAVKAAELAASLHNPPPPHEVAWSPGIRMSPVPLAHGPPLCWLLVWAPVIPFRLFP